jgi:hypothetical protein
LSDKTIPGKNHMGTVNDPDDISAMAGYLLMSNEFETKGIVVASTHRKEHKESGDQGKWATSYFTPAYEKDIANLNKYLGGYPSGINFQQSSIKENAEKFDVTKDYKDLSNYTTVKNLIDLTKNEKDVINVLIWGSTTEPAILVKHCISTKNTKVLKKLRFIAHWTNSFWHQGSMEAPQNVANCREDASACAYMKEMAKSEKIQYFECGAIGQHGIVSSSQKGEAYYNQFKTSELGKLFIDGKYVQNSVDHSDAATYWSLLGKWGVSLNRYKQRWNKYS